MRTKWIAVGLVVLALIGLGILGYGLDSALAGPPLPVGTPVFLGNYGAAGGASLPNGGPVAPSAHPIFNGNPDGAAAPALPGGFSSSPVLLGNGK